MGLDVHVLRTCAHVLAFMFDVAEQVGLPLGWGGMFTFLEHAHMFLCTETCLMPCILCKSKCLCLSSRNMNANYSSHGVGWGGDVHVL